MKCEFCASELNSKASLKVHQKQAKYCIQLQLNVDKTTTTTCSYCLKDVNKFRINRHTSTCRGKIKQTMQELESVVDSQKIRILELEIENKLLARNRDIVEGLASQPKTTTNKTTNKVSILAPLDLSSERLKDLVEANFTNAHLLEGQKGVARFTVEHVIKDEDGKLRYICTDPARHTFRFKEGDTEIKDVRGKRLSTALAPPVMDKTGRLGMQAIKENPELFCVYSDSQQSIRDMRDDDAEFRGELASMVG
jgi:hypothetical protein